MYQNNPIDQNNFANDLDREIQREVTNAATMKIIKEEQTSRFVR